jgi:hypothetical protein
MTVRTVPIKFREDNRVLQVPVPMSHIAQKGLSQYVKTFPRRVVRTRMLESARGLPAYRDHEIGDLRV